MGKRLIQSFKSAILEMIKKVNENVQISISLPLQLAAFLVHLKSIIIIIKGSQLLDIELAVDADQPFEEFEVRTVEECKFRCPEKTCSAWTMSTTLKR